MAVEFEKLSFTKDWKNASDYPTYEENETQVRADMQALHDETRDFINGKLIPGIEGMAVPGAGDMLMDVYDTTGRREDVYAYATAQANAAKEQAKADINEHLADLESAVSVTPGPITLFKEYKKAGTYTVTLPADTVLVYALAVGAGGGGGCGYNYSSSGYSYTGGGAGGAGGNARFVGPVLASSIANATIVVGAGGDGGVSNSRSGKTGGSSSVFGIEAAGGKGGADDEATIQDDAGQFEYLGGSGGRGGRFSSGSSDCVAGSASVEKIPFTLLTFSAGGGGGGAQTSGANGGVCGFGSGGKGGDLRVAGNNGGQCCGGGGGGAGLNASSEPEGYYNGGKGGDGYVAIWVQRSGITE